MSHDDRRFTSAHARWTCPVAIALLALGFVVSTFALLRQANDPGWQDTDGYLSHALYIAEREGLAGFLRESFSGTFPITERHPLYLLMLAPFASQTADFFWTAKLINLATGLVLLLTLVWMVAQRYGRGPALLAGVAYALSSSLGIASSQVNHETQFTFCMLWTWWFLTQLGRSERGEAVPPERMPADWRRWAVAGAWLGLGYMVKSPALLTLVAIGVAALWHAGWRFLLGARPWALLAAAALCCSPLLVRNVMGFGEPFYEGVNSHVMWMSEWSEVGGGDTVRYYDRYGISTLEVNGLPTMRDFLDRNGAGDIAARLLLGSFHEVTVVARDALSPPQWLPLWIEGPWAYGVLALAVAGWWRRRRSWDATLVFFWSGAFIVFFGWNTMFPDLRYLAPLIPIWIAYAAAEAWRLATRLLAPPVAALLPAAAVAGFALLSIGEPIAAGKLTESRPRLSVSPSYLRLTAWLNANIAPGDRFVLGPTDEFYGLNWMLTGGGYTVQTPDARTLEGFLRYLDERRVRYIVIHPENAYGIEARLRADKQRHFGLAADGSLVLREPLPGWRPVHRDPGAPSRFVVLKRERHAE